MEFLETLKSFWELLVFLFKSLPEKYQMGVVLFFALSLLLTLLLSFSCEKKVNKKNKKRKKEPKISTLEIDEYFYKNVQVDENHKIEEILLTKKGIFIIFENNELKGTVKGDIKDENLTIKKKKINNPFLLKEGVKIKTNNWLRTDISLIKTIFISKKIKKAANDLDIYKTKQDFLNKIKQEKDIITNEDLFKLSERLVFLEKRKKK